MTGNSALAVVWPEGNETQEYPRRPAGDLAAMAVFDPEDARRQLGIDESSFARIFDHIWLEVSQRRSLLDEAFEAGDLARVALHAHTIKSSAATIGAKALSVAAARVEQAAQPGGRLETVAAALTSFHAAKETLSKLLGLG